MEINFLNRLKLFLERHWGRRCYSQEGEDIVLADHFVGKKSGFYVDVGAHNPKRLSNTYFFYRRGWSGVNIDPIPGMKRRFDRIRPRDINVEVGIAQEKTALKYYEFNEPALNGFDEKLSLERHNLPDFQIVSTRSVEVAPLASILDKYLPPQQEIDFFTIDAEGYDFEVLHSNDWTRYRPAVIVVELRKAGLSDIMKDPIYSYMTDLKYSLFACTGRSCFFRSSI